MLEVFKWSTFERSPEVKLEAEPFEVLKGTEIYGILEKRGCGTSGWQGHKKVNIRNLCVSDVARICRKRGSVVTRL